MAFKPHKVTLVKLIQVQANHCIDASIALFASYLSILACLNKILNKIEMQLEFANTAVFTFNIFLIS